MEVSLAMLVTELGGLTDKIESHNSYANMLGQHKEMECLGQHNFQIGKFNRSSRDW